MGKDVISSARFGNAVAGLTVTKMGAQPSMPTKDELENFLRNAEVNI